MKQIGRVNGMYYEKQGSGEAIIFIHGIGATHRMFEPQVRHFSQTHTTITVDLLGNGDSDSVVTRQYAELHVHSLFLLMEHLQIEKATFVGVSYGGIMTQLFAIQHPSRVKQMVLIDTYANTKPQGIEDVKLLFLAAYITAVPWMPRPLAKRMCKPMKKWELAYQEVLYISEKARPKEVACQLLELYGMDILKELEKLEIPTLVMVGDHVESIVEKSREMAIRLKNGQFCIVKNAFDPSNLCQPTIVNEAVEAFVKETSVIKEMAYAK